MLGNRRQSPSPVEAAGEATDLGANARVEKILKPSCRVRMCAFSVTARQVEREKLDTPSFVHVRYNN